MCPQTTKDGAVSLAQVSTGHLPPDELVQRLVDEAHNRFKTVNAGENAQLSLSRIKVENNTRWQQKWFQPQA